MRFVGIVLLLAACGTTSPSRGVRFRNAPVVTALDDRADVPVAPTPRPFVRSLYFVDTYAGRRAPRALELRPATRARNVNAIDEVPDDTWFENRIGKLAPEALLEGPSPQPPFSVLAGKSGGVSPGLIVKDARGTRFVMKFDAPGLAEVETGADVVAQRLLWAVGYHTSRDTVSLIERSDLVLGPGAKLKDPLGRATPMTDADVDAVLARADRRADGKVRVVLSEFLRGVPLGGYAQEGTRPDDPNDRVPHDDRRDVRGAFVFFSWLNHVDLKEDNTLDMWVEDEGRAGKHYVRHHLVDFGGALGTYAAEAPSAGYAYAYDPVLTGESLVSLGLWMRPWEHSKVPDWRGVGHFHASFDPARWRPRFPWAPFERFDRFDGLWGARILARVTEAHVRAAVRAAKYEDPRAETYIAATLMERRAKILAHWFRQAAPLDGFTIAADQLCWNDLLLAHVPALDADETHTRYELGASDGNGRTVPMRGSIEGGATACAELPPVQGDGVVIAVTTVRGARRLPAVEVHLAPDPATAAPRIVGLHRH